MDFTVMQRLNLISGQIKALARTTALVICDLFHCPSPIKVNDSSEETGKSKEDHGSHSTNCEVVHHLNMLRISIKINSKNPKTEHHHQQSGVKLPPIAKRLSVFNFIVPMHLTELVAHHRCRETLIIYRILFVVSHTRFLCLKACPRATPI